MKLLLILLSTLLIIWFLVIPVSNSLLKQLPIAWGSIVTPWLYEGSCGNWSVKQKNTINQVLPIGTSISIITKISQDFDFYSLVDQLLNNNPGADQGLVDEVSRLVVVMSKK